MDVSTETDIDGTRAIAESEVVYDACLIEEGEVRNVIYSVELGRVHLGEGIERNLANLEPPGCEAGAGPKHDGRTSPPAAITISPTSSSSFTTHPAR